VVERRISSVDELVDVLAAGASHHDEEDLDLLQHSLQCAALLARSHPDDDELQLAGLVHDVGTVLVPGHPESHAGTGAAAVVELLGARTARLVARHADAKRYLVTTDPEYRARLSPRSIATLETQGGTMDHDEVLAWRAMPGLRTVLALRRADDAAKVPGAVVPDLASWRAALAAVAARA
jgi:predicted HD phosphohydrolase